MGFTLMLLDSFASIGVSLFRILRREGVAAMREHWKQTAWITLQTVFWVTMVLYGPVAIYSVIRSVYNDHQALVSTIDQLQRGIPAKDKEIASLQKRLTGTCYMPDRHLSREQRDAEHDALRQVADKYNHPRLVIGIFRGDTESLRFFGEVWTLFRDAGFHVPQQPLERLEHRKVDDPPNFGSPEGLSIQVVMGESTVTDTPRNHLAEDINKAWNDSIGTPEQAISQLPTGRGMSLPEQKHLILWIGHKKVTQ